jgi:TolA-binding protein
MKRPFMLALCALIATSVFAQTDSTTSNGTSAQSRSERSSSSDIQELRDAIAAQQQQIQQLQEQTQQLRDDVRTRDSAIKQLETRVGQAQSAADKAQQEAAAAAAAQVPKSAEEVSSLQHDVADLKTLSASSAEALQDAQKRVSGLENPMAIHYKDITLTPGGFLSADTVWRSHATLGDIATQFNGIPFSASGQAHTSEFYGSGRASRFSLLAEGQWGETNLTGYYEADFLGAGVTSTNSQANSYVLRQRQVWGQAGFSNGWTVTGGQMWSLVTEMRAGLDPLTWVSPQVIDTQYNVGFSYTRQYGVRLTRDVNDKVWFGMSVENAQTLLTVSGNPTNFLIGGPGNDRGAYNPTANYSSNYSPDFVAKVAFQQGFGHYEIFGVASIFHERIYPNATASTPSAAGAFSNNTAGGGVGANARWMLAQKHVEVGLHYLGGTGVGRYGAAQLPDVTVYGNGYEHLVRSYQGLFSLEYHAPKWDLNLYGGGEYAGRQSSNFKGKPVGYGSPLFVNKGCGTETLPTAANGYGPGSLANCAGNTRAVFEGTAMFWYKVYHGPKGRLQLGGQYSYVTRDAWSGNGGQPEAVENMIFSSFRYYLP